MKWEEDKPRALNKYICIITLFIMAYVALFSYREYESYKNNKETYSETISIMENNETIFIRSIINDAISHSKYITERLAESIQKDLIEEYKYKSDEFIKDLSNPTNDSPLSTILDKNINKLNLNDRTTIFITSMNNILYTKDGSFHSSNKDIVTWEEVKNTSDNKALTDSAIKDIININNNNNYIFWEIKNSEKENSYEYIPSMDINKLLDVYRKYDYNIFKNYELLIPAYITKTGDILGNEDYDLVGKKNDTYKIIVIQRVNMYNIVNNHSDNIIKIRSEINNIKENMESDLRYTVGLLIQSILFLILLLIISWIIQKRITFKKD